MIARDFYVTLVRGKRTAWLAGPFSTHEAALAVKDRAKALADEIDPRAHFDLYGTASLPADPANPYGVLNRKLGVIPRAPYIFS